MENRKTPSPLPRILYIIGLIIASIFVYKLFLSKAFSSLDSSPRTLLQCGYLFILLVGCRYIQGFLHELGHLVFGLLCHYHFLSFRLFSMLLIREKGQLKLRHSPALNGFVLCTMAPPPTDSDQYRVLLPVLGGALMNLITGVIFGGIGILTRFQPLLCSAFFILAAISLLFALLDLIPFRNGPLMSECYWAIQLQKNPPLRHRYRILLAIEEQVQKGIPMKDMPDEWFTLPGDEDMKDNLCATLAAHSTCRMIEKHQFSQAQTQLKHLLAIPSALNPRQRGLLTCDLVFTELLGECRAQVIQELFTPELQNFVNNESNLQTVRRTLYAYEMLVLKRPEAAAQYKSAMIQAARHYPCPWEMDSEWELLELVDAATHRHTHTDTEH